ncbi:PIN domain-containing protein [Xanthomonas nasturtii]|uniref:PIN domain-containing protein n=1 Tax=Xanthomonas nasturtii TaxID=1843581 RepID=A0ABT0LV03_9XANT|nr:PIN domain-containing protein [Xanthomonas nasturtii]MCL1553165.1 PIN domain-containing protein [Xanthomonas nasturtii]MCL1556591.1 PIN domain-containing protein [Xanthomonas nasturtii]
MPLVTRNVFIDTEFFVKANLDFNSRTIKSFEDLCGDDELNHVTSTIVVSEVKRKIVEHIKDALKGINNFRRKAAVLKEYSDDSIKSLFIEINEVDLEAKALAAFDNFIDASNASIVDMSGVDGNEIIDMFFRQETPFSAKKPNEFRDAFSLLAIRSKLREQEKIYIVSADPDHKAFCEKNDRFVSVDTLSAFLDIYNKHSDQRSRFVEEFLLRKKEDIKRLIKEQLEQAEAYNSSTWEDAELDSFKVLEVGDFEPEIIHLDDESCQITFDVDVKLLADVSGPDYVNGHYDKEDGVMYTFDTVARQDEEEQSFSVELDLSFEADAEAFINDQFELNIKGVGGGIEFSVEETPWEDPRM